MFRNKLGIVVVLFSLLGGGYALFDMGSKATASPTVIKSEDAQGYAAAFLRSYLTYNNGKAEPIRMYTELPDVRSPAFRDDKISQRVVEMWPVRTEILTENHMNVRIMAVLERSRSSDDNPEKNRRMSYQIDVPVTQGTDGKFDILQYPKIKRLERTVEGASLPFLGQSDTSEGLKVQPMLESFFRTYFTAKTRDDVANFFQDVKEVPEPQDGLFTFEGISKIDAYKQGDTIFTIVNVKIREPYTSIAYNASYVIRVAQQDGKYVILSMDDE
ncbi:conjugal transfer protein [Aneurinibacillus aneurinilyticus]